MDIFSAIGNTPLVQLKTLTNGTKAKIFGKLEGSTPGGSIKDRPAYYMIKRRKSPECSPGARLFWRLLQAIQVLP